MVLGIKFQTYTTLISFLIPNPYHYVNQTPPKRNSGVDRSYVESQVSQFPRGPTNVVLKEPTVTSKVKLADIVGNFTKPE